MAPSPQFLRSIRLVREDVPTFDQYPFSLPAVRELFELSFHPSVTYLVGENGSGKSTLLEAIAITAGFNAEGGSRNFAFSTKASHSDLHRYLRLSRGYKRPKDATFCALKASTTWRLKSIGSTRTLLAVRPSSPTTEATPSTPSRTASRSWLSWASDSRARGSTSSMNPRPRCRRPDRWRPSSAYMSS